MTGGMGYEGLAALRDFVQEGGTLVTLGSAGTVPVEFGMVRGVSIRDPGGLFSPGSIVGGRRTRAHPILWGYDAEFPVFDRFGPYLSVTRGPPRITWSSGSRPDRGLPERARRGPRELGGHPAVLSVPVWGGKPRPLRDPDPAPEPDAGQLRPGLERGPQLGRAGDGSDTRRGGGGRRLG
jgi:hypothetical protein